MPSARTTADPETGRLFGTSPGCGCGTCRRAAVGAPDPAVLRLAVEVKVAVLAGMMAVFRRSPIALARSLREAEAAVTALVGRLERQHAEEEALERAFDIAPREHSP